MCCVFFPSWLDLMSSPTVQGRERQIELLDLTFENCLVKGFWPRYKHQVKKNSDLTANFSIGEGCAN